MLRALVLLLLLPWAAFAATGEAHVTPVAETRLISAENAVAPDAGTLSAAVDMNLAGGWKTYWRSPGEVGLPPRLDWSRSENVAGAQILWPAPTRFTAFGIENFGYEGRLVLPVRIALERPGEAARLRLDANFLVCAEICVPEEMTLALDLPAGLASADPASAALIAAAAAAVPEEGGRAQAHMDEDALTVRIEAPRTLAAPDVFPVAGRTAFAAPEIAAEGATVTARFPLTSDPEEGPVEIVVTDGDAGWRMDAAPLAVAPSMPRRAAGLGWVLILAFAGGAVLNLMPCVLPVLGIKLAHAASAAGGSPARVRAGFLASGLGALAFVVVLGGVAWAARAAGLAVGWGMQFQSPVFLAALVAILALFASNLAGLWELRLPPALSTFLSRGHGGLAGDFATGAFAAILATPCSAPFLGTAVAFALASGGPVILAVFGALGVGLALPYLLVAAFPGAVRLLPRPGRWMLALKGVLALLLAGTALWLLWVLSGVAGQTAAALVAFLALAAALAPALRRLAPAALPLALAALLVPLAVDRPAGAAPEADALWVPFDRGDVMARAVRGEVVLVDVTADWCLTCKVNEAAVLDGAAFLDEVTPMRADWTRPDPAILDYLIENGRYGIPFNAVYGPAAPEGIVLPEILTTRAVEDAIEAAR
ncbi:suppressor for copper-sensitivity B [Hasllibacter halocynthiae]|uniref:Suppressor for copper-sensitivity B n=1 Tax=Hasllibacter halocynthiae TaxID=595589 RepID=A0A2T0X6X4_9RHOB|nr:protein-disulfide reductase DsbD domain-containing protein [Hasllibacter halocynthiae]PRY94624.1 suppressor for copper-sensitivity B [Hasllibacter halocynthiae]